MRRAARKVVVKMPEIDIQKSIAGFLTLALPRGCGVIWFHIPNGGRRSIKVAKDLKAMGVRAGVYDLAILWAGNVGWIEVKTDDGRLSDAQMEFKVEAETLGHRTAMCRTPEDVERTLRAWGVPLRATLLASGVIKGAAA